MEVPSATLPVVALLILSMLHSLEGVKFPNDIDGQPEIECGDLTVRISVKTTNGVASKLYAKGHYADRSCTFERTNNGTFSIGSCGMNRQRQLEPRGVSYGLVVVVQLHPMFVTKVDRAYSIKCFYMEAEKTVTSLLDVSMISTQAVTGGAPMPVCNYELHADTPNGPGVRYARVGDKVWHTWSCPSPTYGILVHSCVVTDGQGNDFKVLDEKGCSMDQYVIRTPEYSNDLTRVQQETHVFKFADKTAVLFNCQIKLCQKADNGCEGTSPPKCPNSASPGGQSEQLVSESPPIPTASSSSAPTSATVNSTSVADVEATTPAVPLTTTVNSPNNRTVQNETFVSGNETGAKTLSNVTFPTPQEFQSFVLSNRLINSTTERENASIIFANETTVNSSLPQGHLFQNVTDTGSKNESSGIAENITATPSRSRVNVSFTATGVSNVTVNVTASPPDSNFTSVTSILEVLNISIGDPGNFSSHINNEANVQNLTTAEGFLLLSKSGHKNLSSARQTEDGVTEIYYGEGSGYWETDATNDSMHGSVYQNRTSINRTTTVAPLTLANATIVIVGDDGRGRRNVLSPLLDAAHDLIKREDDDRRHQDDQDHGRRFRDEPYERLPDIETDVSQLMWVLEPEEGAAKDGLSSPNVSQNAHSENPLRSLDDEADDDELYRKQWPNGRVCLSSKTLAAVLLPLLAVTLVTVAVVFVGLRRLRVQNKLVHFHHSFPLNYLYKRP